MEVSDGGCGGGGGGTPVLEEAESFHGRERAIIGDGCISIGGV